MLPGTDRIKLRSVILVAIITGLLFTPISGFAENSCRTCHGQLEGELAAPVQAMAQNDVHASRGFSCEACHGGDPTSEDPEVSMSAQKGFLGVPSARQIPEICARCHAQPEFMRQYNVGLATDQYEKYWTSRHGIALKAGSNEAATCIDCHGSHGVLPANNPQSPVWPLNVPKTCRRCHEDEALMSRHNLPANTYKEYSQGVHGVALLEKNDIGAPACNDCHGNHGATPPGFEDVAQVCRGCHPANSENFLTSPHKEAFDAAGIKECLACHSNHLILTPQDDWLGVEGEHSCGQCHTAGEKGYQTAVNIRQRVDSLRNREVEARFLVHEAERRGIEVSQAQDYLKLARDALLLARTMMHTVDETKVGAVVDSGLVAADEAAASGRQGIADFRFRSLGLGVASILITILIIALWLKLRQIEKK
jgi:predicted CXXCH cytochrome family protein